MNRTWTSIVPTSWGSFGFVVRGDRLAATFLPASESSVRRMIAVRWSDAEESMGLLPDFVRDVRAYFDGCPVDFDVEVDWGDLTPFRVRVLKACRQIPYGRTSTYADLARITGRPLAARAVGGAMANNPLPLVVPCHRVVRCGGGLGGFSAPDGVAYKERMLQMEARGAGQASSDGRNSKAAGRLRASSRVSAGNRANSLTAVM